ncbi:T6SS effector BTH_I2691 family protein [Burkholderia oklahomensis]|uniref:T6SS effector BTH_I2691 family protein n=1 Tax=Burkholderia oklahomensis TaxID=342113 RepID=UPI0026572CC5|nr:T6SS effector BTH_I2691 family protein [Burkholderia oklahomensis]MDN7673524.1 T6SS effector BTH_I2691 family protein [Burkholderia oklahomensis]
MNSSVGSSLPPTVCQFCDKKGLPILPLRYAIARKDKGNAPELKAPFLAVDKKKEQGKDLSKYELPGDLAHYTTRLLRPGYLYVYDEARKEWSAYVVTKGAYLFQFDPYAKAPPGGWGKVEFSCKREGDAFIARCITVKNAAKATKVWLGFSDVAWTKDVLDKNSSPAYREAHMRSIDVAAWRGEASQPHAAPFAELASRVAEYATTPGALNKETATYVTSLLPVPYRTPSQLLATDATTKRALAMSSSLIKDLLPAAVSVKAADKGKVVSAAWAFSPQDFYADAADANAMIAWGAKAAKPHRPALVALDDPAGIAMELNGLALQRSAEFSEDPQLKWKHDTALLIGALKEAVGHGAVEDDVRSNENAADLAEGMANIEGGDQVTDALTMMTQGYGAYKRQVEARERAKAEERQRIREASEAKSDVLGDDAWKKYTSYYDKPRVERELAEYQTKLNNFSTQTLVRLDAPYLVWLKSGAFSHYLSHNFDSKDLDSGASYTELITQVIHSASGRTALFNFFLDCLKQDPKKPEAWLLRAGAFNNDALIKGWLDKAAENGAKSDFPLADLAEKFHDKFKDVMVAGSKGELRAKYMDRIARFVYQYCGPLVKFMSDEFDAGATKLLAKPLLSLVPAKWQIGLLGCVAREGNPNLKLVDLRGMQSFSQATKTLAKMLAATSGSDEKRLRESVRPVLRQGMDARKKYPFRGIALVDEATANKLKGRGAGALSVQDYDEIMYESVRKVGNLDVKVGVVQLCLSAYTLSKSYEEMMKAEPDKVVGKAVNFGGGVTGLVGGVSEMIGNGLEKFAWGATKTSWQFKFQAVNIESRASWLTGGGKILGVIGGIIGGVMSIKEGLEIRERHTFIGWASIGLGIAAVGAAVLMIIAGTAGIGFIVGVVVAVVMMVNAWIKPNALQDWLSDTLYGMEEKSGGSKFKFKGLAQQEVALAVMGNGV